MFAYPSFPFLSSRVKCIRYRSPLTLKNLKRITIGKPTYWNNKRSYSIVGFFYCTVSKRSFTLRTIHEENRSNLHLKKQKKRTKTIKKWKELIPVADSFHFNISIISRGKGKSAVASAAYISCEKITNEWDGELHDYTHKDKILHTDILLPICNVYQVHIT